MSVTTGVVRASFVHVYQAVVPLGGGDPKYNITLLIPKSDINTINAISAEIAQVKQANVQLFSGQAVKIPLYDGDGLMPSGNRWGEECWGCMVLRASSKEQPTLVDTNIQPLLTPNAVYSGCYVRASVNLYAYNQPMNKGIGCGINSIQKIADGEPLANRISPEEAFGGANEYQNNGLPQNPGFQLGQYQLPQQAPNPGQQQAGQYQTHYTGPGNQMVFQQPQATQIDPITGNPVMPGGVMGI